MMPNNENTKQIQAKLKWVELEFVNVAFDNFVAKRKPPITMAEYDMFVRQLFTKESKVQVICHGCSVNFAEGSALYALHLGYVTDSNVIMSTRPIVRTYNMKDLN